MFLSILFDILLGILVVGTILVIIGDTGDSGRKIAWLLVITVLPVVGVVLYLCLGFNQRHHWLFRRRHKRYLDKLDREMDARMRELLFEDRNGLVEERYRPLARLLAHDAYLTPVGGNSLEIITTGHRKYELLLEDLRNARESIHMEYFHFGADLGSKAIREVLLQKAREGVKVRFINENVANFPISARYYDTMKKSGVEVVKFTNPRHHLVNFITRLNYRNHRKVVVIDGKIGYTGGMNINDHYFLTWRDTHLRITGGAVAQLQFIFMDSWLTAGGQLDRPLPAYFPEPSIPPEEAPLRDKVMQIVPDEPDDPLPVLQMSYVWGLANARDYFYIQTPYFVPPEPVMDALKTAAAGGVDVRVMLPEHVDTFFMGPANRSFYRECIEAGVRIFERKGEFIHSKTFVSDDYLSSIGTANLDPRSFSINYEDNAYIYDRETALLNKEIFLKDLEICQEITLDTVDGWSRLRQFGQKLIRLFSPLL